MKTKIYKFGFEVEGEFSQNLQTALLASELGRIVSDCSVKRCGGSRQRKYHATNTWLDTAEFVSKPILYGNQKVLVNKELITIFKILQKYYLRKEFHWNKSAGFHIHISFNPKVPVEIWSKEFNEYFFEKMKNEFKLAWNQRSNNNTYCRPTTDEAEIALTGNRYYAINFSPAFVKHGTIEFRIFPAASPKAMRKYLSFTFKTIKDFLNNETHRLNRKIDFEPEDDTPKSQTIERTVDDKLSEAEVEVVVDDKLTNNNINYV